MTNNLKICYYVRNSATFFVIPARGEDKPVGSYFSIIINALKLLIQIWQSFIPNQIKILLEWKDEEIT